jgi:hypothetical protein
MTRKSLAVGAVIAAFMVAGCGSSTTSTVTIASAPRPAAAATIAERRRPERSTRVCSAGVTANSHASCRLADLVLLALSSTTREPKGIESLGVESSTTPKTNLWCSSGKELITCRSKDAVVTLTRDAVRTARTNGHLVTGTGSASATSAEPGHSAQ